MLLVDNKISVCQKEDEGEVNMNEENEKGDLTSFDVLKIAEDYEPVKQMRSFLEDGNSLWPAESSVAIIETSRSETNKHWQVTYSLAEVVVGYVFINSDGKINGSEFEPKYITDNEYCQRDGDCIGSGCCGMDCANKLNAVPSMCDMVCHWEEDGDKPRPCKCIDNRCQR